MSPPGETSGPTQETGGVGRSGTHSPSLSARIARGSSDLKELMRMPRASGIRAATQMMPWHALLLSTSPCGRSVILNGGSED